MEDRQPPGPRTENCREPNSRPIRASPSHSSWNSLAGNSAAATVGSDGKHFFAKALFFKTKQSELLLFPNAPVPQPFYSRFLDLVQLYDRPVKSKLKPKFMAWKVKVLGENEDSKRPFIVILCDTDSSKKIRKFFAKKEVRQQCQETDNLPSLPVLVIPSAPVTVATDVGLGDDAEVPVAFGREESYLGETTCGESIKVVHTRRARMATIGGIVKVVVGGQVALYGMTAGHVVDEEMDTMSEEGFDTTSEDEYMAVLSEDSGIETSEDGASSLASAEQPLMLEPISFGFGTKGIPALSTTSDIPPVHVPTEASRCNYGWTKISEVVRPAAAIGDFGGHNLDWSLIGLTGSTRAKMNLVKRQFEENNNTQKSEINTIYKYQGDMTDNRPVIYQPGTEPGYLKGKISTYPSFICQSPSRKLTRVYNMTWDSGWDKVSYGDCGSWVVDRETRALYGHVVATDIFDEAYVVPFEDTVAQIEQFLGADAVGLPSKMDFATKKVTWKSNKHTATTDWMAGL
ncbi:hypothetical protein ABW20_dc0109141 [Dactylellina cionopaga]|nr:hypothetical protein ABW20_dc0109141 [Dactylellina cionopaga]